LHAAAFMMVNPSVGAEYGLLTLAGHYWILHFLSRLDSLALVPLLGPASSAGLEGWAMARFLIRGRDSTERLGAMQGTDR
jgi:hypothetical protein